MQFGSDDSAHSSQQHQTLAIYSCYRLLRCRSINGRRLLLAPVPSGHNPAPFNENCPFLHAYSLQIAIWSTLSSTNWIISCLGRASVSLQLCCPSPISTMQGDHCCYCPNCGAMLNLVSAEGESQSPGDTSEAASPSVEDRTSQLKAACLSPVYQLLVSSILLLWPCYVLASQASHFPWKHLSSAALIIQVRIASAPRREMLMVRQVVLSLLQHRKWGLVCEYRSLDCPR